jgi:hypothetical protein
VADDVSVIVDDLLRAARRAAEAADLASAVPLPSSAESIIPAMPASDSARSAEVLGRIWRDRLAGWCVDVEQYAEKLTAVGEGYLVTDGRVAVDFRSAGR